MVQIAATKGIQTGGVGILSARKNQPCTVSRTKRCTFVAYAIKESLTIKAHFSSGAHHTEAESSVGDLAAPLAVVWGGQPKILSSK